MTTPEPARADPTGEPPAHGAHLPAPGTILAGKYRVEGLLGRGGMGVVVLGRQLELDRPVAIKFLRAPLEDDARPLQRFGREARMIARMQSEHVVRVFDVGREQGQPFIVMERLHGHDLAREIARGALPVERAVELVLHACEALGEAHSLGIVHRDVKPSNLFVAESFGGRESLKVLDFGVSKWLTPAQDSESPVVTTGGGAVGTPAFASPEQLTHPERVDLRSDVWALGVVLYQALSGELPFRAPTVPALYSQIIGAAPTPLPERADVPAELVTVVMRCLRRKPEERYPSMLAFARALAPFAPGRAHSVVDSLIGLESARVVRSVEDEAEPVLSPLTSTLEISEIAPEATSARSAPARRRGARVLLGAIAVAGLATALALLVHSSAPDRSASSKTPSVGEPLAVRLATKPELAHPSELPASDFHELVAASASISPSASTPAATTRTSPERTAAAHPRRATPTTKPAASAPAQVSSAAVAPQPTSTPTPPRSDVIPLYRR